MDKKPVDFRVQYGQIRSMKLDKWLTTNKMSVEEFAKIIGKQAKTVYRYINGERFPHKSVMPLIKNATDGIVTADSFYIQDTSE